MRVLLHNMETGEDTEIVVPLLSQLRIELDGYIPDRGKTKRIFDLSADLDDVNGGDVLDVHASEGRIWSRAFATNAWQLGIGD